MCRAGAGGPVPAARLWARVTDGELPWWRAARIADHTLALPMAGAISVDRHLAPVAHKVGIVQTERLCQEALDRFDPQEAEARREAAAEARHVDVPTRDAGRTGTVEVAALVDLADALDLETAVAQAAAELAANGSTEFTGRAPVDGTRDDRPPLSRRRPQHRPIETGPLVKPRRVIINVYLRDQDTGRCDTTRAPISVEQVQRWCTHPDTQVIIRAHPRPERPHPGRRLRGSRPAR